jgi:hypothetical protein
MWWDFLDDYYYYGLPVVLIIVIYYGLLYGLLLFIKYNGGEARRASTSGKKIKINNKYNLSILKIILLIEKRLNLLKNRNNNIKYIRIIIINK